MLVSIPEIHDLPGYLSRVPVKNADNSPLFFGECMNASFLFNGFSIFPVF
jgi:hypothetical protein